jgi:hypothetical protein
VAGFVHVALATDFFSPTSSDDFAFKPQLAFEYGNVRQVMN